MKKFNIAVLALSVITGFTVAGGAFHRPGPEPPKPHEMMDVNTDGRISLDEWDSFHDNLFENIDGNRDGFLEDEEFRSHHKAMVEKMRR